MIIRFSIYLFISLFLCEFLALSAVTWSFYESATSSLNLLKYTSDNKARDILSTIARVAETRMSPVGYKEMDDFFLRLVKKSEKDLDKYTIQEIFLISKDGKVLSHSNPREVVRPVVQRLPSAKYQKPFFLRAHRMRKGQTPIPQNFGSKYEGDGSFFSNLFIKYFKEIQNQTVIVSAPVYHQDFLETVGSVHLVYNRGNFLFFLTRQKDIFVWMLINYTVVGAIFAILIWVSHMIFAFLSIKDGIKQIHSESEYEPSFSPKSFIKHPSATITAILKNEVFHTDINTKPRLEAPKVPPKEDEEDVAPAMEAETAKQTPVPPPVEEESVVAQELQTSEVETLVHKADEDELALDLEDEDEDIFSMPDFDNADAPTNPSVAFHLPEEEEDFQLKEERKENKKPEPDDKGSKNKEVLDAIFLD
ncbi:MAG: hypothetical protein AAF518_22295 [Spirochaetota bacterium]